MSEARSDGYAEIPCPGSSTKSSDVAFEQALHEAREQGDLQRIATLLLERYSAQIARFLSVRLRSRALAEEAFSQFAEDLWRGLPAFRWSAPVHVWLWVLARNAASRVCTAAYRKHERLVEDDHAFAQAGERARTETARFLRTATKQRMRELRSRLSDSEQTLLLLRVDRALSFEELAVVMGEASVDASEAELARASARVRTRFQSVKQRLRALAEQAGLLAP